MLGSKQAIAEDQSSFEILGRESREQKGLQEGELRPVETVLGKWHPVLAPKTSDL